jgi:hypothetical protein
MVGYSEADLSYHPSMSASEAAKVWMRRNELTDNGRAAINYEKDGKMSVRYEETTHGIDVVLKNGTSIPVPYKYQGEPIRLI